jgi:methyltransferase
MRLTLAGIAVFLPMLIEAQRAARNERARRAAGGVEPSGDVYATMRIAYPLAFAAMLAEGAVRHPPPSVVVLGAATFVAAKAIKWWAIVTLGPCWTFRVIVVPDGELVDGGPYRWMRHPNYVGVVGELLGTALGTGAWVSGVAAIAGFGMLLARRIRVEEEALVTASGRPTASN